MFSILQRQCYAIPVHINMVEAPMHINMVEVLVHVNMVDSPVRIKLLYASVPYFDKNYVIFISDGS
jgi:hypothetical protein